LKPLLIRKWRCPTIHSEPVDAVYHAGLYFGSAQAGVTNNDVHIKDVVCDGNYSQGISMITAENLLIEDTVLKNTAGTQEFGARIYGEGPGEGVAAAIVGATCRRKLRSAATGHLRLGKDISRTTHPTSVLNGP